MTKNDRSRNSPPRKVGRTSGVKPFRRFAFPPSVVVVVVVQARITGQCMWPRRGLEAGLAARVPAVLLTLWTAVNFGTLRSVQRWNGRVSFC